MKVKTSEGEKGKKMEGETEGEQAETWKERGKKS